jgi:hypothetical protein
MSDYAKALNEQPPKVEPCACGTMRAAGSKYHGALLRAEAVNDPKWPVCDHGRKYFTDCSGRVPPPCCWEGT